MNKQSIRILTYNIHKGFDIYNRDFVLHKIRERLHSIDVDVIFLQEILGQHRQHEVSIKDWPQASQFEYLADQIWPHYAYGKNAIYEKGHHGNAILSKFSIQQWQNINVSRFQRASRSLLHGVIHFPDVDSPLHLICVHLELVDFERQRQLAVLIRYINESIPAEEPIIVAGDFNDWSGRSGVRLESELKMKEVFRVKHGKHARTFPSSLPVLKMDRIYYRGLNALECECFNKPPWKSLSDHSPLYAKFDIQ